MCLPSLLQPNIANFYKGRFVIGYVLWRMDFTFCSLLTSLKRSIGMPWSFLLEFHGWWHVLTAFGAYTFMILVENLTREDLVIS